MNATEQNSPSTHLSRDDFELLLADGAAGHRSHACIEHLNNCTLCQSKLTERAADAGTWSDAQNLLSGSDMRRWEPDLSFMGSSYTQLHDTNEALREQVDRLLDPPNHPELLGRLGRFDIERVLGSGGMGIVLKAHDTELNRPIAIKMLAPDLAHNGAARERFAREGRAAAAVVHEHVVAIHNVESGGRIPFLVMQYVPGRSLDMRVQEDGPLGVEEILRIGSQADAGLADAHRQGLVHRDVKPANILLENSIDRAVLTDFGLARAIDDASLTRTGILAGTPHYMSPEQARGEAIDHRSDLFSLGSVLYFMATGHPPFRGSNAMGILHRICRDAHRPVWQVNREIPDELSDAIDRLLSKKPAQRFASAEEVQEELASLLSRLQRGGLRKRSWHGWRRALRRRNVAAGALAAVLAIALPLGMWWTRGTGAPSANRTMLPLQEIHQYLNDDRTIAEEFAAARRELAAAPAEYRMSFVGADRWLRDLSEVERDVTTMEAAR